MIIISKSIYIVIYNLKHYYFFLENYWGVVKCYMNQISIKENLSVHLEQAKKIQHSGTFPIYKKTYFSCLKKET